jgi:hypothetical protein
MARDGPQGVQDVALLRDHHRLTVRISRGDAELDAALSCDDGGQNALSIGAVNLRVKPRRTVAFESAA